MGISALKQCLVCKLFKPYVRSTGHVTDKFNERRWYFRQGIEEVQHFLGSFSLGPLPNHQALHCPAQPRPFLQLPQYSKKLPNSKDFQNLKVWFHMP